MDDTAVMMVVAMSVIWYFLEIIGNWMIFKKAGRSGGKQPRRNTCRSNSTF